MEVTDEVRRAVYAADCKARGHIIDQNNAIRPRMSDPNDPQSVPTMGVNGPDGQFAHLVCRRCQTAWIVIEEPGVDHDDAARKLLDRLKPDDPLHGDARKPKPDKPAK